MNSFFTKVIVAQRTIRNIVFYNRWMCLSYFFVTFNTVMILKSALLDPGDYVGIKAAMYMGLSILMGLSAFEFEKARLANKAKKQKPSV